MNYVAIYKRLMKRAKSRNRVFVVSERHHIKPKCLGGGNASRNLVVLTPAEHYLAHQLLVKIFPGNGKILWAAIAMTSGGRGKGRIGNKLYSWLRTRFIKGQRGRKHSKETKRKIGAKSKARTQGADHPSWGMKRSRASCKRISAGIKAARRAGRGRTDYSKSDRTKALLSEIRKAGLASGIYVNPFPKGSKHSAETRKKMRQAHAARAVAMKEAGTYQSYLNDLQRRATLGGAASKLKRKVLLIGIQPQ